MKRHQPPTFVVVLIAAVGAVLVAVLGAALERGDGIATAAARYTARYSFYWFVAAWSASALARLWPGGWRAQILFRRRAIGLGFAVAHGVHFLAVLAVLLGAGYKANLIALVGGGAAYVFVALMALTSNDFSVRALGRRGWALLHGVGGYVLASIFAFTYYRGLSAKPAAAGIALAVIAAAALLRAAAWAKGRLAARASPGPA